MFSCVQGLQLHGMRENIKNSTHASMLRSPHFSSVVGMPGRKEPMGVLPRKGGGGALTVNVPDSWEAAGIRQTGRTNT